MVLITTALFGCVNNGYANNYLENGLVYLSTDTIEVNLDNDSTLFNEAEQNLSPVNIQITDTSKIDSIQNILEDPKRMESSFKSKVKYHADDSIMIDNKNNKAYLWGNAWVEYEDIKLDAHYLEIDFAANEVLAMGLPDSTGKIVNTPVFKEKGQEYQSGEMVYNFNTKKGLIKKITTQEASGYIHGETVKMASQDVFYIKNGRYTTCSLDHPHYYVQSKKLKIINNDKIVTGPAYLAVEDVPTFLAVPFGFFPNQDERTSGILIPAIGSSETKGFSLSNGGYYFGISDQYDLKILGDIYSNGSWSGKAIGRYNSRYKRQGTFQFSYTNSKAGEKDAPDYTKSTAFFVNWRHKQDPKAKPNSNFTAMVNLGSSNYFQNDLNVSTNNFLRNEFSSNITYTQKFGQSPFSASLNASHNQNNQDSTISFTLPELNVNMSRIYPFKRKVKVGKDKWYEKVGVIYSGAFKNEIETRTDEIFGNSNLADFNAEFNNGVKQRMSASTSFKLGHLNISPGVSYNETWYFKAVDQAFDTTTVYTYSYDSEGTEKIDTAYGQIIKDTTKGFNRYGSLNFNASLSTKMYGMYAFRGEKLKAIRHTITPSVSFSYQPNLNNTHPEYFGETETDTAGNTKNYTVYDGGVYGVPNGNESGNVSFQIQNIIEMKHKKRNDTTDSFTNTKLIDAWNFNTSYNMLADSFNWAPVRMDIRAKIGKMINIAAGTTSDFYGLKSTTKTDPEAGTTTTTYKRSPNFNYASTGVPLRLTQFRTSVGLSFKGNSSSSEKEKKEINTINEQENQNAIYQESQYVDFNIPWNLRINYVLTYNKPLHEVNVVNSLNFSGGINITPGWKIMMRSSFDFKLEKLGYTTMNVYRDLHCWQIDLSVTPFGTRKSFMINLKVKQGFLQDLKLSKNSRWFDS